MENTTITNLNLIVLEQILTNPTSSTVFEISSNNIFDNTIQNRPQQEILQPPPIIEEINLQQKPQESNSNILSSVFSTFSKKLINSSESEEIENVAPPAGIESIISQEPTDIQPIPLFPAASASQTQKPSAPPPNGNDSLNSILDTNFHST